MHPFSFFQVVLRPFVALDLDGDMALSSKELGTPYEANFENISYLVVKNFKALRSLPNDGKPVSVKTVSDYAEKTFKHFDDDGSGDISFDEYFHSFYTRMGEFYNGIRQECKLPDLSDSPNPAYAVILGGSDLSASYKFHSEGDHINYAEIYIEKQSTPLNLIVVSGGSTIWAIKGDVKSINKMIVFGPPVSTEQAFDTFLERPDPYVRKSFIRFVGVNHPGTAVTSAVTGIPSEKVQFSNFYFCLDPEAFSDQETKLNRFYKKKMNERALGFPFSINKPHLLEMETEASHIVIKSSPEIVFDTQKVEVPLKLPTGFKKSYWDLFLEMAPKGYKFIDPKKLGSGLNS